MHRPLAQRPRGHNLSRFSQICCKYATTPRQPSLYQHGAKALYATLGHGTRRVKPLQHSPKAGPILNPTLSISRSYRFGASKPVDEEAQAAPRVLQVAPEAVIRAIEKSRDDLLAHDGIPSEQDVLDNLRMCDKAARLVYNLAARHDSKTSVESDTSASSLLSLDGSETERKQSRDTKVQEHVRPSGLLDRISEAAYDIVSHPTVIITPQVLDAYVEAQARLGRVETLPYVLSLYASKPKPQGTPGSLQYEKQNPDAAANAVDTDVVEKALDATIEARNLDAAIGVIESSYTTKAFIRAKLLKKALFPASVALASPFAIYIVASSLAHYQNSLDHKTATVLATAGLAAYVFFTGSLGMISTLTYNDHMKRVTWATGTPLVERWCREEERAALDKVACSFGYSQAERFGEEEGPEFKILRHYLVTKGMILDRVESMEGMR